MLGPVCYRDLAGDLRVRLQIEFEQFLVEGGVVPLDCGIFLCSGAFCTFSLGDWGVGCFSGWFRVFGKVFGGVSWGTGEWTEKKIL